MFEPLEDHDSNTSDMYIWKVVMPAARGSKRYLWRELRKIAPHAAADRVEMHRQPARRHRIPHRVPPRVPQLPAEIRNLFEA